MTNKRIFYLGKVREINSTFVDDVKKDLEQYLGKPGIGFTMRANANGGVDFIIPISFNVEEPMSSDVIPVQICWLILGECETFRPEYPAYCGPCFPNFQINIAKDDYIETYRQNSKHYRASRIKDVDVRFNDTEGIVLSIKW